MSSDSIANASSLPFASSNPKEFAKKKRVNRSAKLKQCKLDARREQWLSQVKNKGSKEETNGGKKANMEMIRAVVKDSVISIEKIEIKPRNSEENESMMNNYSDSESSPTSHASSVMGSNDSVINFTGTSHSSSSSSCSGGCCSEIMSEEDECDDWEAMADAEAAANNKEEQHNTEIDSIVEEKKQESGNFRAWRVDDVFRPQGLPNLSKQKSFPQDRNFNAPTSCPICCEDLDLTDTSFLPCYCGFRLCLFCHKTILEDNARCPGCRKQYNRDSIEEEATLTLRLARSCSMSTRF